MIFNKDWTKEDNDILRGLIKEGKTPKEIVSIIGYDKLNKNPKKKYVDKYSDYILNEIFIKPKETEYKLNKIYSPREKGHIDYKIEFKTKSDYDYILDLIYLRDIRSPFPMKPLYNISFTIKEQHNLTNNNIYEIETNKGEIIELMKRLIYILNDVNILIKSKIEYPIYLIGETNNTQKINFYRNVIKDSLKNFTERKGNCSYNGGKQCYYYYEKI